MEQMPKPEESNDSEKEKQKDGIIELYDKAFEQLKRGETGAIDINTLQKGEQVICIGDEYPFNILLGVKEKDIEHNKVLVGGGEYGESWVHVDNLRYLDLGAIQRAAHQNPEEKPEHIPSLEEVQAVLERLLKGEEYEVIRKIEDERGLDTWEVRVNTPEGASEFSYKRQGSYDAHGNKVDVIHVTFFDNDDFPIGGHAVAKYIDSKWKSIGPVDPSEI